MEKQSNLIDCIDKILLDEEDRNENKSDKNMSIDDESVQNEPAQMVLYMTPNQLLQILQQRAVLLPNNQLKLYQKK